jgi:hypothetical protein
MAERQYGSLRIAEKFNKPLKTVKKSTALRKNVEMKCIFVREHALCACGIRPLPQKLYLAHPHPPALIGFYETARFQPAPPPVGRERK